MLNYNPTLNKRYLSYVILSYLIILADPTFPRLLDTKFRLFVSGRTDC